MVNNSAYSLMFRLSVSWYSFNTTHQLDTLHSHFHFIKTQSFGMFRASLVHRQEALHERSFGGCSYK
jgi:hypothetical protein